MTTADYEPNVVLSTKDYDVIGSRPIRPNGANKVTGRSLYGVDYQAAGLLHGKVLSSPHGHARIRSIDTSRAEALEGVRAVITSKDLPVVGDGVVDLGESTGDVKYLQDNVLARKKALYKGHAIAAVAATRAPTSSRRRYPSSTSITRHLCRS